MYALLTHSGVAALLSSSDTWGSFSLFLITKQKKANGDTRNHLFQQKCPFFLTRAAVWTSPRHPALSHLPFLCAVVIFLLLRCARVRSVRAVFIPCRAALSPGVGMTGSQPDGTEQVCSMWPLLRGGRGGWSDEGLVKERRGWDMGRMAEPVQTQALRLIYSYSVIGMY